MDHVNIWTPSPVAPPPKKKQKKKNRSNYAFHFKKTACTLWWIKKCSASSYPTKVTSCLNANFHTF